MKNYHEFNEKLFIFLRHAIGIKEDKNFIEKYNLVKSLYPNVVQLSENEIKIKQNEYSEFEQNYNTSVYIVIIPLISLFYLFFLYCGGFQNRIVSVSYLFSLVEFNISLSLSDKVFILLTAGLVFVFGLMPRQEKFKRININFKKFKLFEIVSCFIAFFLAGLVISSFGGVYLAIFMKVLALLGLVLFIFIYFIIGLSISIFISRYIYKRSLQFLNSRIKLSIALFDALLFLDQSNGSEIDEIIMHLDKINKLIINFDTKKHHLDKEISNSFFYGMSVEFEKNKQDVLFMKQDYILSLKDSLVMYLNVFLNADLRELPVSKTYSNIKIDHRPKFLDLFVIGVYLLIPIAFIIVLKKLFHSNVSEDEMSFFYLAYVVWIFLGIISNPSLWAENKALLKEVFGFFKK